MNKVKIAFSLLLIGNLSCKLKNEKKHVQSLETKVACIPYFEFDEVEHCYIKIEELDIWKVYEKKKKTDDEKRFIELILGDTLDKISDTVILKGIEKSGYAKKEVPKNKFESLNNIFCEKKKDSSLAFGCIHFYRDILIFKKENKIVGTAKVCFACSASIISGTKINTMGFGQSGDYSRLEKLLYNP